MRVSVTQKVTKIKQGTIKLKSNMLTYTLCSVTWNITLNTKKPKKLNTVILKLKECLKAEKNGISLSQKGTILL